MAATGGEQERERDHFGSESLWIPAGGTATRGEEGGVEERVDPVQKPTSMAVSWTESHQGGRKTPGPTLMAATRDSN